MYLYTTNDKIGQLKNLNQSLGELIPISEKYAPGLKLKYEEASRQIISLLDHGFSQEDLTELSNNIPDVISRHKDWESSMLEQTPSGGWDFPAWFVELESVLQPVLKAAHRLREIGYY